MQKLVLDESSQVNQAIISALLQGLEGGDKLEDYQIQEILWAFYRDVKGIPPEVPLPQQMRDAIMGLYASMLGLYHNPYVSLGASIVSVITSDSNRIVLEQRKQISTLLDIISKLSPEE